MINTEDKKPNYNYMQNRELSWLKFNERVMSEALDSSVPLFERFKFLSIFKSNLDEFFMIRVGSLHDMSLISKDYVDSKSGMTAKEQLKEIFKALIPLYKLKDQIYYQLDKLLAQQNIIRLSFHDLQSHQKKFINDYYETNISPILSPQIVDAHHPFPHLENKSLYIVSHLKSRDKKNENRFGIISVPKALPRLIFLSDDGITYMLIEDIILEYADTLFRMYELSDKAIISVIRNADINPDDESYDFDIDYRDHMKQILKKRKLLSAVSLEIQDCKNSTLVDFLCSKLNIKEDQAFYSKSPLDLSYVFALENRLPALMKTDLQYATYEPIWPQDIRAEESIMRQVCKKDILLHYPYESMSPFLQLVKEASTDPQVLSIKITLYRINKLSKLIEYLIDAAENNKDVTVMIELRARFDEQNNIEWAERLQNAGCNVIYGLEGLKVHAKICLITRYEKNKYQYFTQISTGNYNEKTSRQYTDLSLITANEEIGADAVSFFKNLSTSNTLGMYRHLLVAPTWLKRSIIALIDGEIIKHRSGQKSGILFKMNSLTDKDIIDKLTEASQSGVNIKLIIRGICCIVPGISRLTDNITVISIVGRFLEHSRIYCFGDSEDMQLYISSADMMTRNTERRVEIACPILDKELKARIRRILELQLSDNVKATRLQTNSSYLKNVTVSTLQTDSQAQFIEEAIANNNSKQLLSKGFISKTFSFLQKYIPDKDIIKN